MAWLQYYLIRIGEVSLKKFYIKNYVHKLYISQQYIKILARGII
ncbi:hypothetical protein BvCmsKSNP081_00213 [Escherichia coli]|nr:hypothetical protein BvCmsKSNP081_00213 [Escherichia coli]